MSTIAITFDNESTAPITIDMEGGLGSSWGGISGDITAQTDLQSALNNRLTVQHPGRATAIAGSKMKIDYLLESSTYKLEDEASIWSNATYSYFGYSKEFTSSDMSGSGGPTAALFSFANNNGNTADVCAFIADAVARTNSGTVFGGNFVARGDAGITAKMVGAEIDVEPAATGGLSAGSGGLYLNIFNVASASAPAIQLGGSSGGKWGNGLVLDKISGSGVCFNAGASGSASAVDVSGHGVFSDSAIILGNGSSHRLKMKGTASAHAGLYNDTSDNVRLVLGAGGFFVRNNADAASVFNFNASGDFNPSLSVTLNNTKKLILSGTATTHGQFYNDSSNNIRLTLGSGVFAIRDSADAASLVTFSSAGDVSASGNFIAANTKGITLSGTASTNARLYNDSSNNVRLVLGSGGFFIRDSNDVSNALSFNSSGVLTTSSVVATGAGGVGYATGAGGAVTQATSKSTGVTLNKASGQITMNGAALASGSKVSFVVTNSTVAATDVPLVAVSSGGTANAYRADVTAVAAGSFTVTVENITAGSLSEAPVINFNVMKGVAA
jgi:hypothetical protein